MDEAFWAVLNYNTIVVTGRIDERLSSTSRSLAGFSVNIYAGSSAGSCAQRTTSPK